MDRRVFSLSVCAYVYFMLTTSSKKERKSHRIRDEKEQEANGLGDWGNGSKRMGLIKDSDFIAISLFLRYVCFVVFVVFRFLFLFYIPIDLFFWGFHHFLSSLSLFLI